MSCGKREREDAPTPTNKKSPFLRIHTKKHKRHHSRFITMKKSPTTVRVQRFISKWRAEKLQSDDQKKMHVKNFKLYMENKTIQENNKQLRMKLQLLRQENMALLSQFQQRLSNQLQTKASQLPSTVIS